MVLIVVDALQLMWLAWNSHKELESLITEDFETYLQKYTTDVLQPNLTRNDKVVFVWDNLALKKVDGYQDIELNLGVKNVEYVKQIIAHLDILSHFVNGFFQFIKTKLGAVQIWSKRNTADDVMYMYIRNIQKNTDPPPYIVFIPNSKSLFGLVDDNTCVYIPALSKKDRGLGHHTITIESAESILGCDPQIFMLRRVLRGDFEEGITPVSKLTVEECDNIEEYGLMSSKDGRIDFFMPDAACGWFSSTIASIRNSNTIDIVSEFRDNYAKILFLPMAQLYVQRYEKDT